MKADIFYVQLGVLLKGMGVFYAQCHPGQMRESMPSFIRNWLPEGLTADILQELEALYGGKEVTGSDIARQISAAEKIAFGRENATEHGNGVLLTPVLRSMGGNHPNPLFYPLRPIELSAGFMPAKEQASNSADDLLKLWEIFAAEVSQLQRATSVTQCETMLFVLKKYASCLNAGTGLPSDISLYHWIQSLSAFSACLSMWMAEHQVQSGISEKGGHSFFLVRGDISGIQPFLYDIVSKNASKFLKGRSFYLQLLADSALNLLLRHTGSLRSQVILASGGGFMLLLPNTHHCRTKVNEAIAKIEDAVFKTHKTSLVFSGDWIEITKEELMTAGERQLWKRLIDKQSEKKSRRFSVKMKEDFSWFFTPQGRGGLATRDALTNEELTDEEGILLDAHTETINPDAARVSAVTHSHRQLAMALRDATWWVQSQKGNLFEDAVQAFNPCGIGEYHYFLKKENSPLLNFLATEDRVLSINSDQEGLLHLPFTGNLTGQAANGFVFYGGSSYPVKQENPGTGETSGLQVPVTFDELTGEQGATSFRRLGVLRMDVDSLGSKISTALQPGRQSFARLSAISEALDWFFKGYLNHLRETDTGYRDSMVLIYSGGDDLFAVGKWDEVLRFAEQVARDFSAYTGGSLHISGGITIQDPKYPVSRAAFEAGEAEDAAKDHSIKIQEGPVPKNAISFLGLPVNWDFEFEQIKSFKGKLFHALEEEHLPQSVLGKIRDNWYKFDAARKQQHPDEAAVTRDQTFNPWSWRWKLIYDLGRMIEQSEREGKELLSELKVEVFDEKWKRAGQVKSRYETIELLNLAARWAELELRSRENQEYINHK